MYDETSTPYQNKRIWLETGSMARKQIEILEHTADIALRLNAKDLKGLFKLGGRALYEVIGEPVPLDEPGDNYELILQAGNREDLFHDWLMEILYWFQVRKVIFDKYKLIILNETRVKAIAHGRKIDTQKSRIHLEIKAVTYHHLKIEETQGGITATVIFDI